MYSKLQADLNFSVLLDFWSMSKRKCKFFLRTPWPKLTLDYSGNNHIRSSSPYRSIFRCSLFEAPLLLKHRSYAVASSSPT